MIPMIAAMAAPSIISSLTAGGQQGGQNPMGSMLGGMLGGGLMGMLFNALNPMSMGQQQPQSQGLGNQQFDHLMNRLDDIDRDIARQDRQFQGGGDIHHHHHHGGQDFGGGDVHHHHYHGGQPGGGDYTTQPFQPGRGTQGDDVIKSGQDGAHLIGNGGDDKLVAKGDDQTIIAGSGDDIGKLKGEGGFANMGSGDDKVKIGGDNNVAALGSGDDTAVIKSDTGHNTVVGGSGNDTLDLSKYGQDEYTITYDEGSTTSGRVDFNNGGSVDFSSMETIKEREPTTTDIGEQGGTFNIQGQDEVTIDLGTTSGSAGYNNNVGYYVQDKDGNILGGGIIEDNAKEGGGQSVTIDLKDYPEGAELGLFSVPNGDRTTSFEEGDKLNFAQNGDGKWTVSNGSDVYQGDVWFSDSQLNGDDTVHFKNNGNSWGLEDLRGGGDRDYNDVMFTLDVTGKKY